MKNKNEIKSVSNWRVLALMLFAAAIVTIIPDFALADSVDDGEIGDMLCRVAKWFNGPTGKAIATIAVIFLGIAAFFGKVTWGLAIMFAVGIFAIFGAAEIVDAIAGDNKPSANCGS